MGAYSYAFFDDKLTDYILTYVDKNISASIKNTLGASKIRRVYKGISPLKYHFTSKL